MTKTATQSTLSPFSFAPGNPIRGADLQAVHEAQNEARCNSIVNLLCIHGEADGWGTDAIGPHSEDGVTWPATGTTEVYRCWVYIDPDIDTLFLRTRVTMASGTGSAIVYVGSTSGTHAHTGTGTITSTYPTSSTGTGWQLVRVNLAQDTGDPSSATLDRLVLRSQAITATALPDLARYPLWSISQSGDFDGSDDYVDYGNVADLDGASSATWSFWVYQSSLDAGRVLHRMGNTGGGFRISVNASGNVEAILRNSGTNASETTTGAPITAASWHHVAIVYASSALTIYVDGSSAASTTFSTLPSAIEAPTPSGTLRINESGGSSTSLAAYLSNLAFWAGTAASAAQVAEIYASGSPPDLNDLATLGSPTWWVPADGSWAPRNHASAPTTAGGVAFVASVPG